MAGEKTGGMGWCPSVVPAVRLVLLTGLPPRVLLTRKPALGVQTLLVNAQSDLDVHMGSV